MSERAIKEVLDRGASISKHFGILAALTLRLAACTSKEIGVLLSSAEQNVFSVPCLRYYVMAMPFLLEWFIHGF